MSAFIKKVIFVLVLILLVIGPRLVAAQDDGFVKFDAGAFTVSIPAGLEGEKKDNLFIFAADDLSLEIMPIQLPEGGQDSFLDLMQAAFAGTDYTVSACPDSISLSCVEFKDIDGSAFLRAIIGTETSFYAITFRASDEQGLLSLQPDDVLSSFTLADHTEANDSSDETTTTAVEPLFNVVATGAVNVRECGTETCARVGQTTSGQVLAVIAIDNDWYQIEWEGGTAYIASWLTTRGPDVYADLTDGYVDDITGCGLVLRTSRGENSLAFAISGDRQGDVWVDIYRPNESAAVQVDAQYDKTFIDTEEPYIYQTYYWGSYWPTGAYQVQLTLDGKSSMIGFDIDTSGDQLIYVDCD